MEFEEDDEWKSAWATPGGAGYAGGFTDAVTTTNLDPGSGLMEELDALIAERLAEDRAEVDEEIKRDAAAEEAIMREEERAFKTRADPAPAVKNLDIIKLTIDDVRRGAAQDFKFYTAATAETWTRVSAEAKAEILAEKKVRNLEVYMATEENAPWDRRPPWVLGDYIRFLVHEGLGEPLQYSTLKSSRDEVLVNVHLKVQRLDDDRAVAGHVVFLLDTPASGIADGDRHASTYTGRFLNFYLSIDALSFQKDELLSSDLAAATAKALSSNK